LNERRQLERPATQIFAPRLKCRESSGEVWLLSHMPGRALIDTSSMRLMSLIAVALAIAACGDGGESAGDLGAEPAIDNMTGSVGSGAPADMAMPLAPGSGAAPPTTTANAINEPGEEDSTPLEAEQPSADGASDVQDGDPATSDSRAGDVTDITPEIGNESNTETEQATDNTGVELAGPDVTPDTNTDDPADDAATDESADAEEVNDDAPSGGASTPDGSNEPLVDDEPPVVEPPADDEPPMDPNLCAVQPLTDEFRASYDNLDPFYQKYADANGLPVVSSTQPADEALTRACLLVIDMLSARPDVQEALIQNHVRFAIIAESELTNDIPEFSYLPDSINQRARGLGGVPTVSCAEESILCHAELDPWRGEGICVHEFAHTISMAGIYQADPTFEGRLTDAYESARDAGLFADTYAMESPQEYWAEGVQNWYYTNLESDPPNGIHNHVDTREEMQEYDPVLYDLVAEFFPDEPQFVDCYSDEDEQ
jgi:hypothetical protein